MKKSTLFLSVITIIGATVMIGYYLHSKQNRAACSQKQVATATQVRSASVIPEASVVKTNSEKIQWMNISEVQEKMKTKPKKIFIDLYTDWCGWCKVLDKETFTQKQVIDYLNENYYSIKFNAEQKESVTFAGNNFNYVQSGRTGYHELAAALTAGNLSYPMLVFINENLQPITYAPGFKKADELMDILVYIKEDIYKRQDISFTDFQKNRKKKLQQKN